MTTAQNQITITNLLEAYTIVLTNEAQQFPTDYNRTPLSNVSCYTDVLVYHGTAQRTDFTIGTVASDNNITVSQTGARITFSVKNTAAIGADSGTFVIPITIDGQEFEKVFSWSCSKQGVPGEQGTQGINLLRNTKEFAIDRGYAVVQNEKYNNLTVRYLDNTAADDTTYKELAEWRNIYPDKLGQVYTFSFYAKGNEKIKCYFHGAIGYLTCTKTESSQGIIRNGTDGNIDITLSENWERYWIRWTLKDEGDTSIEKYALLRLFGGNEAYVCGVKLEKGTTDNPVWTPAIEDLRGAQGTQGINLLRNTQTYKDWMIYPANAVNYVTFENGVATLSRNGLSANYYTRICNWIGSGYLEDFKGKTITISFEVKSENWDKVDDDDGTVGLSGLRMNMSTINLPPYGGNITTATGKYFSIRLTNSKYFEKMDVIDGEWTKIVTNPITISDNLWTGNLDKEEDPYFTFQFILSRNGTVLFRNAKIEFGEVENPVWTPAIEDLQGADGIPGRIYMLDCSDTAIKKGADNVLSPASITFKSYYRDGDSATRTDYAGRFKIEESSDGNTFTTKYTSSADENSKTYTPSSSNLKLIRCTLYAAGGTTNALDSQSVVVLTDISNLEIGARNLILKSGTPQKITSTGATNLTGAHYFLSVDCTEIQGKNTHIAFDWEYVGDTPSGSFLTLTGNPQYSTIIPQIEISESNTSGYVSLEWIPRTASSFDEIYFRTDGMNGTLKISNIRLYLGNKDVGWTPAPEDLENEITETKTTLAGVQTQVNNNTKSITNKIWQSDIAEKINNYDLTTTKSIRDRLTIVETDITGIESTVSDVQTVLTTKADGSTVTELQKTVSQNKQTADAFQQTVTSTYATKTDVSTAIDNIKIGGRNLLRNTSSEWKAVSCDRYRGRIPETASEILLSDYGLKAGDTVTLGFYVKTTSGKKLRARIEFYISSSSRVSVNSANYIENGEGYVYVTTTLREGYDKIGLWVDANLTTNTVTDTTTEYVKCVMFEKATSPSDWTPAPEDLESSLTTVQSQYTQLADKFSWIVESGTSASNFTITDRLISLTSIALNIDAITTFMNNSKDGSVTVIDGGSIKANTITTTKLATDAIKSQNYSYTSGNFSGAGTFLDLSNGAIKSKNFAIDTAGNAYFKGNVQMNAGYIGGANGWSITEKTITGSADSKLISGLLQSANFVENTSGVQINLNTGIIKGEIEATRLAAKEALQIYSGNVKRNIITSFLVTESTGSFYYTSVGCDLTVGNSGRVNPSIIFNKSVSGSTNLISINTSILDIYAQTSVSGDFSANSLYTQGTLTALGNATISGHVYVGGTSYYFSKTGGVKCSSISCSGNTTISGNLTVSGTFTCNNAGIELYHATPYIDFHYNKSTSDHSARIVCVATGLLELGFGGQYGALRIDSVGGTFYPVTSGNYSLGGSGNRFYKLWLTTAGIDQSSLESKKIDIHPFTSALSEIDKTDVYNYKGKDIVKRNGDDIVRTGFVIGDGYNLSHYLLSDSGEGIDLYSAIGVTFAGVKELYEIVKRQQKIIEGLKGGISQ